MNDSDLTLEQRVFLIEHALERLQSSQRIGSLGICVNAGLHPDEIHPHWNEDLVKLAKVCVP